MSCTEGYNKDELLAQVSEMTAEIKGKKFYRLSYPSWEHGLRLAWLMRTAKLTEQPKQFNIDETG